MAHKLTSKICSSCKAEKPISAFGKQAQYKDGFRKQCTPCRIAKNRIYRMTERGSQILAKQQAAARAAYQSGSRPYCRWSVIKNTYGISKSDYEAILQRQDGRCAICKTSPMTGRYLAVDHCHQTNRVRGLLCNLCNQAIGMLGDNLEGVERAIEYLRFTDSWVPMAEDNLNVCQGARQ